MLSSENDSGSDIDCSMLDSSLDSEVLSCPVECTAACCGLEATVAAGLPYQVKLKYVLDHTDKKGLSSVSFVPNGTEHIFGWYFAPQPSMPFVTSASTAQLRVASRIEMLMKHLCQMGLIIGKKADEQRKQASSCCHRESVMKFDQMRFPGVDCQLSKQLKSEQHQHHRMLMIQLHSLRFLLCQGLAVRGQDQEGSNLFQLLKLLSEDHGELKSWVRDKNYLSSEIINGMVALMG